MIRLLLLVICATASPAGWCLDPALTSGLAVSVDRIPEPVSVDGVPMSVQRVTGSGVPELAQRFEQLWRRQGSETRTLHQGSWTMLSRMLGAQSELVQWRNDGVDPELIWSSLDSGAPVQSAPDTGLKLPASCAWGRSVSGRSGQHRYLQRSARCLVGQRDLSSQLQQSVPSSGWHVLAATDSSLTLERDAIEGQISLVENPGDKSTWLTWLRVEQSR